MLADEAHRRRLVDDRDAAPLHIGIERLEQLRPAAPDVQREPAPELELAVDLVGLPAKAGLQLDALLRHPGGGLEAAAHQDLAQLGVGAIFGHLEHVVEELVLGIGAEIDVREILVGERRQHRGEVLDAAIGEAEGAAGEVRVAAALLERRGFQHQHACAVLVRRDGRAERGVAGADHEHVGTLLRELDGVHDKDSITRTLAWRRAARR